MPEEEEHRSVFLGRLADVSSATLSAITSAAPIEWRTTLTETWKLLEATRDRDLELLARDSGSVRAHMNALANKPTRIPEETVRAMADIVLRIRDRRRERVRWVLGIVATAILGPLATILIQRLF